LALNGMTHGQVFSWKNWWPVVGVVLCCSAACAASVCFRDYDSKSSLPLPFIAVVTAVALRFGSLAGLLSSCASAAIFALFLFPPIGSLRIQDVQQRTNVGWFLVAGLSISFLFAASPSGKQRQQKTSRDSE
jgi:K+-sensing histidine kinase KdpD